MNVSGGTIQVGTGGTSGSTGTGSVALGAGTLLRFNPIRFISPTRGVISGAGGVRQSGSGTLISPKNHPFTGLTTIDPGATLQLGNASGGATGGARCRESRTREVLIWDRGGSINLGRQDQRVRLPDQAGRRHLHRRGETMNPPMVRGVTIEAGSPPSSGRTASVA